MTLRRPARFAAAARVCAVAAAALALAACTAEPTPVGVRGDLPERFSQSGERDLPDRWWRDLDDPALNRLVETALADNPSLKATWARLRQANAIARREGAARFPTVDGSGSAQRTERDRLPSSEQYGITASAAYEVDLWGRLQSLSDAARFDAEASAADVSASAITLSANVARAWYRLVEARARRDLLEAQLDTNERVLRAVEARFRQGQATAADVLRQRQLAESRRGDLAATEGLIETQRHELAALLGKAPGTVAIPDRESLIQVPPVPDTGLPARLIQRRPDIRRAFFDVQAADQRVAAAIADQYPRIDLTASFDTTAPTPSGLFETWIAQFVGQLSQPVFDAGRRAAEVDRSEAALSESLNQYEDNVLTALTEVENALADERARRRESQSLAEQQRIAEQVVERLRQRYVRGVTDFLDVLDSLSTEQDIARRLLGARRDLILARIDLARALAGGFALPEPDPRRLDAREAAS